MSRWLVRLSATSLMLVLPLIALASGAFRLIPFLAMPLVVLGGPLLLGGRGDGGSEGDAEDEGGSDDGPGGNRRPDHGPARPSGPTGELPLEHSTPGSWRLRGGGRQHVSDPDPTHPRRAPHRPTRTPRRVPAGPHVG